MKKIHDLWKMLYGMLLFLAVSCSTPLDDNSEGLLSGTATGGDVAEGTRQLQIEVRNKLVTAGAATRKSGSIALNTENEITAMDFYVFASDDEFGTYTFQEKLSYRAGHEGDKIEGATPFILVTNSNNNAFSSAQLTIKKGLYVRLYCVANATQLYVLNEKKDPKVYEPATLEPLQMELDGNQMKIKVPGTSEEDFLSKFTVRPLDPTNLDDIIKTPLLMTGSMAGCINLTDYTDNAVINTSLKLTRGVVRFDVRNTASQSNLTIESVSMTQGNATTALFPLDARPAADGSLITYPQKLFPGGVNEPINQGLQEAAFYSYATPDQACLVLTGTYSTPGQEPVAVKYEVPFNNLQDGEGQHISLQPNHRYTVNINEADPYEVKFAITVADWENGESLDDYDPADANKLHFAAINLNDNVANSVKNSKHTVRTYNANTAGVNQGTITFYSNSDAKVRVTYANGDTSHPWVMLDAPVKSALSSSYVYSNQYVFTLKTKQMTDYVYPPATLIFQNATGGLETLELHPRELYQGTSAYTQAYRYGHDNKYFLIAHADATYSSTYTWNVAQQKCRKAEGWRLPSLNDLRQLFKFYEWDTKPYLHPATAAYKAAFSHGKSYTYAATPGTGQFGYNGDNVLYSDGSSQNIAFGYDTYYWTSDVNPENGNDGGVLRAYSTSNVYIYFYGKTNSYRVRCIKDWN